MQSSEPLLGVLIGMRPLLYRAFCHANENVRHLLYIHRHPWNLPCSHCSGRMAPFSPYTGLRDPNQLSDTASNDLGDVRC